jgi:hypothetical protein
MNRKLVSVQRERFVGFGCSECAWVFKASGAPAGKSFEEMVQSFELKRNQEFASHVCADHPRARSTKDKDSE